MGDGQASLEQRSCRTLCTTTNGCSIVAYSFSPRTAKAQKRVENPSGQATYDGRRSGFSQATKLSDALHNNERMQHCCLLVLSTHGESAETRREPKRAGYLRWATVRLLSSNEAVGRFAEQRTDAALLRTRSLHARRKRRMRREPKRAGCLRWATVRLLSSNEAVGRFAQQRTDAPLLRTRSLHARRKRRNA